MTFITICRCYQLESILWNQQTTKTVDIYSLLLLASHWLVVCISCVYGWLHPKSPYTNYLFYYNTVIFYLFLNIMGFIFVLPIYLVPNRRIWTLMDLVLGSNNLFRYSQSWWKSTLLNLKVVLLKEYLRYSRMVFKR